MHKYFVSLFYKLSVQYYGNNKEVLGRAVLHLTAVGKLKHAYSSSKIEINVYIIITNYLTNV